jgi:NDP-sugar pyrophosphorylase family protein
MTRVTVVIPAAGEGRRFSEAGYTVAKPLIPVLDVPMVQRVLANVTPTGATAFVVGRDLVGATEGTLDTILRAERLIDPEGGLLIALVDQLVDFAVDDFVKVGNTADGAIITFASRRPDLSYVDADDQGVITRIVDKEVVSDTAVAGVYYFRRAREFLDSARSIVLNEERGYRGEYVISLAIARMLRRGYRLLSYLAETTILGTPEDLWEYEKRWTW